MARGLLPLLIFGATYLAVRFGLLLLEAQVWGRPAPGARSPWVTLLMILVSMGVAMAVMTVAMRGRGGGGGRGGMGGM